MELTAKQYSFFLTALISLVLFSCSVDNKNIPDPGGNLFVDTTGTLGSFYLNVSGDTSYTLNIIAVDTVVLDSLGVAGADPVSRDQIIFNTAKAEVGTYYTEQSPPGITGAIFLFRKKIPTGFKVYPMLHGKIVISSVDLNTKIISGSIDVNNEYVASADRLYRLRGNFSLKLNN